MGSFQRVPSRVGEFPLLATVGPPARRTLRTGWALSLAACLVAIAMPAHAQFHAGGFRPHWGGYGMQIWGPGSTLTYGRFAPRFYPYAANGVWGPYSLYGPLTLPSNQLFGTQHLPQLRPSPIQQQPAAAGVGIGPGIANQPAGNKPLREANDEALARAWKYIQFGDEHFRHQRFLEAYQRYQSAIKSAPALAEAQFRRGFTLAALNHHDRAADALRQGLKLDEGWPRSNFRLDKIYADNRLAKQARFELLAEAAEEDPGNADLWFLLGVHLYCDGQRDRSQPFLERARQLSADERFVQKFLDELAAEAAAPAGVEL